jgi:hypothetical protein
MQHIVQHVCRHCHRQVKLRAEQLRTGTFRCVCGEVIKSWDEVKPARVPASIHRPPPPPVAPEHGPGTELRLLLQSLGVPQFAGCQCKAIEEDMNRLGVAGCGRERQRILKRLADNAVSYGIAVKLRAAGQALAAGLALKINPAAPLASLFDLALARAAEKEKAIDAEPEI